MEKDLLLFFPCHQYRPELQKNPYGKGPDYREEFHEFLYIIIVTVIILRGESYLLPAAARGNPEALCRFLPENEKRPAKGRNRFCYFRFR
jgi:hypothetical protein